MNEQIKNLAIKSGLLFQRENLSYEEKKFAELIIREYETLLPEICPWDGPKDSPMKGWHVQFVARKHFGIEE